jgi:hypothetical protein
MIKEQLYLKTGLPQAEVTKILVEEIKADIEHFVYIIERHKVPVTLVLLYTEFDISERVEHKKRFTDVYRVVKVGKGYFTFVFLPFTTTIESYSFLKHFRDEVQHLYHLEPIEHKIYNYFNFINTYLFGILDEKEFG